MALMSIVVLHVAVLAARALAGQRRHEAKGPIHQIFQLDASRDGSAFHTDHLDSLRILHLGRDNVIVGGRDTMFNLSTSDLSTLSKISWPAKNKDVGKCINNYNRPPQHCANFIRVFLERKPGEVTLCGTHAYQPSCRTYGYVAGPFNQYEPRQDRRGKGLVPFRPDANATFYFDAEKDQLYTAAMRDPTGTLPAVARSSITGEDFIRTPSDNVNVLNEPQFVLSTGDDSHTYFWFHEISNEASSPCGKCVYSRVARVCNQDHSERKEWTTFMKARLTCSIPGRFPFFFDELQAATMRDRIVYGVFQTPWDGLQATAVCAYRMADINAAFGFGPFKDKNAPCGDRSGDLPKPIQNFYEEPLFVDTSMTTKFTQIAAEDGVIAVDGHQYTVLYLGTADGRVVKMVNVDAKRKHGKVDPVNVMSFMVSPGQPIRNLEVIRESTKPLHRTRQASYLLAASDSSVRRLPTQFCRNMTTCTGCVGLRDPHCAWHVRLGCVSMPEGGWDRDVHVQNLVKGESNMCPKGEEEPMTYSVSGLYPQQSSVRADVRIFRTRDLAIAVCASMACAVIVGFVAGYFIRYRFTHPWLRSTASSVTYESTNQSTLLRRASTDGKNVCNQLIDVYGTPPQHTKLNEAVSLILSMHENAKPSPDKNHSLHPVVMLNNGTLPKDYKVKKVYV